MAFKEVYDRRWYQSSGTSDEDILSLDVPRTQVQFFYAHYNRLMAHWLRRHMGDTTDKRLLEIGCGRGTSSIFQAKKGHMDVFPTDYSVEALRIASRNLQKYSVEATPSAADLFHLPFRQETFHGVLSVGVMEHIEAIRPAYDEMARVLKPGGVMISINVPEKPDNIQRVAKQVNQFLAQREKTQTKPWLDAQSRSKTADVYRSTWGGEQFRQAVLMSGFQEAAVVEINPFPTFDPLPALVDHAVAQLYRGLVAVRSAMSSRDGFESNPRDSRAHVVIASKGVT